MTQARPWQVSTRLQKLLHLSATNFIKEDGVRGFGTSPSVVGLSIGYHGIKGLAIFGMDFARLAGRLVGTALYIEICSVP